MEPSTTVQKVSKLAENLVSYTRCDERPRLRIYFQALFHGMALACVPYSTVLYLRIRIEQLAPLLPPPPPATQ
jgi:hypothetical protein